VDYVPWPESGCSLAEARKRTADCVLWRRRSELLERCNAAVADRAPLKSEIETIDAKISDLFLNQLKAAQLIAYGRLGRSSSRWYLISKAQWLGLRTVGWDSSCAASQRATGLSFFDIQVYPVLLAPSRADLLAGQTLIDAFKRFVLNDPEVAALGNEAVRLSPDFEPVFKRGHLMVYGAKEWPLAFERWTTQTTVHPTKRGKFDVPRTPGPLEVVIAAEARLHRYQTLVSILRSGELEGRAVPDRAGPAETILRSTWSQEDFHFDPTTGDILQHNPKSEGRYDRYIKRWVGVVLQVGAAAVTGPQPGSRISLQASSVPAPLERPEFPAKPPFTTTEVTAFGSLSAALERLVFRHPDVRVLCDRAIAAADAEQVAFEEQGGLVVTVSGHDEPLLPLRYLVEENEQFETYLPPASPEEEAAWAQYFEHELPADIQAYNDAVYLRARTLIEMLQDQKLSARGHVADGHLVPIAHTVWRREDHYIHPSTGDVYEAAPDGMKRKWTGVILEAANAVHTSSVFHGKLTAPDDLLSNTTAYDDEPNKRRAKAIARVETKSTSYKACLAWLADTMRASPKVRKFSKDQLWKKAQEKWPGTLSERSFLDARAEAIRKTGAHAWAASGAPRNRAMKSPR
jgi:hypothetical protein